jgi:hypothetical protein
MLETSTHLLGCYVLLISQFFGLYIGRLSIELPPHEGAKNAAHSAVSIVTGAAIGFAMAFMFALTFNFSPLACAVGAFALIQVWLNRWKRPTDISGYGQPE